MNYSSTTSGCGSFVQTKFCGGGHFIKDANSFPCFYMHMHMHMSYIWNGFEILIALLWRDTERGSFEHRVLLVKICLWMANMIDLSTCTIPKHHHRSDENCRLMTCITLVKNAFIPSGTHDRQTDRTTGSPSSRILMVFSYSRWSCRSCRSIAALLDLASRSSGGTLTQPPILTPADPQYTGSL